MMLFILNNLVLCLTFKKNSNNWQNMFFLKRYIKTET